MPIWKKIFFLILLLGVILFSCSRSDVSNQINVDSLKPDSLLRLRNWMVLAPFYPDTSISVLDRIEQDVLEKYNASDNFINDMDDFILIGKDVSKIDTSIVFSKIQMSDQILDLSSFFRVAPPISAYLACNIECNETHDVVLNVSAYQSAKFFLNGKEVYTIEWKHGRCNFREDFIPVTLKKGINFLLVKLLVSDAIYIPSQWKIEVDVSNINTSKEIFASCCSDNFLRNSLIRNKGLLKVYTGPFSKDEVVVNIVSKNDGTDLLKRRIKPDSLTGDIELNLSDQISNGIYTCELIVDKFTFRQDFFVGDLDKDFKELCDRADKIAHLSKKQKLNLAGLIKRLYIKGRRNPEDFDSQIEYWNRIRIPSLIQLFNAVGQLENKIDPVEAYFLRGYYSNYWKGDYYYSAHIPANYEELKELPVLIFLMDSDKEVRKWDDHWRNSVANGLNGILKISDELGFIAVWTDCGGRIDLKNKYVLFREIFNDICMSLPVNKMNVFLIGNCASTGFTLDVLNNFPELISGCGLINPRNIDAPYFLSLKNTEYHHKLSMLYAGKDEIIPKDESLQMYEKLKRINPSVLLHTCNYSSHYNSPADYIKPLIIDLLN